ncbi:hypothetical protein ACFV3E_31210 [Streptomyces sp. NPDC059718]
MAEHPRRPIVTYETCREAERAVDHVSPGVFVQTSGWNPLVPALLAALYGPIFGALVTHT